MKAKQKPVYAQAKMGAHEIIKDGSCVNQNAVKENMEALNNYLFREKMNRKKKQGESQTKFHWQPQ